MIKGITMTNQTFALATLVCCCCYVFSAFVSDNVHVDTSTDVKTLVDAFIYMQEQFKQVESRLEVLEEENRMQSKEIVQLKEKLSNLERNTDSLETQYNPQVEKSDDTTSDPQEEKSDDTTSDPKEEKFDDTISDPKEEKSDDTTSDPQVEKSDDTTSDTQEEKSDDTTSDPQEEKFDDTTSGQIVEHSSEKGMAQNRVRRADTLVHIAFFAKLKSDVHHLGLDQDIVFDEVMTNIGHAYNPHHGVFVAPLSGIYVFSTTVVTFQSDNQYIGFALNGNLITRMWGNGRDNGADLDGQTIVLYLNKWDDVSVKTTSSGSGLHGNGYSVFSGFLLSSVQNSAEIIG